MDRIGRLLGNLFTAPAPGSNGNGTKAVAAPAEAKAISFIPIDALGHTRNVSTTGLLEWYRSAWLPYACMRYRATKLVEAPIWIAEETEDGEEWLEGEHPLGELLERPNADMEMSDLLELTSLYLDSTGAALWVKSRDRGNRVGALYPFSRQEFEVESADGRLFGRFTVRTGSGKKTYAPEDVVFFRNADPASPHGAVAPLHAALARLGIDRTLVESITAGLRNAIVPGADITFPADVQLTTEQQHEFRASLAAQYENARNHGKTLVLGGGPKMTRHSMGFKDLNGGELAKEIEAAVCACFQTPPAVIGAYVGLENSSDRHNMETAIKLFYGNAIQPTWARMEKVITRSLLREVDPNPLRFVRFDKTRIEALQENQGEKVLVSEKAADVLTVNERRVLLGYPPLEDERGDEITGGRVEAVMPPVAEKRAPLRLVTKARADRDGVRWMVFDETTRAQEFAWEIAAAEQLATDRAAILAIVRRGAKGEAGPSERKDDEPYGPADVERWIGEISEHLDMNAAVQWRRRVEPLTGAAARRAVERMAAELGIAFDLLQPGLVAYTQKEAAWLVTEVTASTKQAIRDALSAGLAEGESIGKLATRIAESGAFAKSRAELIARTETTRVTNGGQRESLATYQRETGNRITKRWLSARDARVRDEHAELDGETRAIDDAFSNGLQAPGEPNCRCALTYQMEDAG